MPHYSERSKKRLATAHQDLQVIFNEVIKTFDNTIVWGHRWQKEQHRAFVDGKSTKDWPESTHNSLPSMAVDAYPYPINYKSISRWYYFAGFVMATAEGLLAEGKITHRVRWGGDWDRDTETEDERFKDLGHFELIGG